nr:xylulose kinase-1 [Tanacetum cinerariifolium]
MAGSDHNSDNASIHYEASNNHQQPNIQPQIITTVSNNNAKFSYLKKDDLKRTGRASDGELIILPLTTAEEHLAVQRESKARTTLLQSIPDDHIVDFHYIDDARDIWNAVKARFGGNVESKKMRKSMLKQEFLEYRISETEGFHKGYDRMQKILTLTLKTKGGLEFLSFDDLYYKLKSLEVDVRGYSSFFPSQSAGPSHSAFVSATSTSKKMPYRDSLNHSSTTTYSAPSNSKTGSYRTEYTSLSRKLEGRLILIKRNMLGSTNRRFDATSVNKEAILLGNAWKWEEMTSRDTPYSSESNEVIAAKEFRMIAGCDYADVIRAGANKLYNLINGANSEEAYTLSDAGEFALMGVTSE